jgi:putative tRNA adenosine deaminase-associated protein
VIATDAPAPVRSLSTSGWSDRGRKEIVPDQSAGGIVSYFAAAVARDAEGWSGSEVSLNDAADVEDVADHLRDIHPGADVSLLFAEFDDLYLVIMRLDQGEDLRVFGSDTAFAAESRFGALLLADVTPPVGGVELETAEASPTANEPAERDRAEGIPEAEPAGDADLLADLGVPASRLLELCAQEGMLPADITAELCQAIGCGDEVEELRGV